MQHDTHTHAQQLTHKNLFNRTNISPLPHFPRRRVLQNVSRDTTVVVRVAFAGRPLYICLKRYYYYYFPMWVIFRGISCASIHTGCRNKHNWFIVAIVWSVRFSTPHKVGPFTIGRGGDIRYLVYACLLVWIKIYEIQTACMASDLRLSGGPKCWVERFWWPTIFFWGDCGIVS